MRAGTGSGVADKASLQLRFIFIPKAFDVVKVRSQCQASQLHPH